jgi:LTXXQ motif family protein
MRNIGAYIFVGVFAALICSPTPSAAFGLHLGPLHFGLPFFGHSRHRHHAALHRSGIYDRAAAERPSRAASETRSGARSSAPAQSVDNSALLYPSLALPALYDQIFWPGRTPSWPFGYDAIFDSAFAKKSPAEANPQACQPGDANVVVERIRAEIKPGDAQMPLFQKLAQALGTASGYLAQACPKAIPPQPVARLQLMQAQIQTLSMALDQIRPPLQQLEQSLNADQRSHFAAFSSATGAAGSCATPPAAVDRPVNEIEQRVAPSEDQREALADLRQAFAGAASDLDAHCPKPSLAMPLARLEAMESQLDASWRATLAMQVALTQFEGSLTEQQRGRFDALAVTAGND